MQQSDQLKSLFEIAAQGDHEPGQELQNKLAYDGNGRLYILHPDGRLHSADIRQQLLNGAWAQDPSPSSQGLPVPVRVLQPEPPIELDVRQFTVSCSGTYAAFAGCEEEERAGVRVVDLSGGRLVRSGGERYEEATCSAVDAELFTNRPGLQIVQASWHPRSNSHLALLTSDNTWRLYNAADLSLPEQTFELQLRSRRGMGFGRGPGKRASGFAFGPDHGWERFAVFFVCSDGDLYVLCPVAPFGAVVPLEAARELQGSCRAGGGVGAAHETALAWLQQVFPTPLPSTSGSGREGSGGRWLGGVAIRPHALQEHSAALCGPLAPIWMEEDGGRGGGAEGRLLRDGDTAIALLALRYIAATTALAVAASSGRIGLHLVAGPVAPQWAAAAPACIADRRAILATRQQAILSGRDLPALLLLDVVDLQLRRQPAQARDSDSDSEAESQEAAGPPLQLLADETATERFFVVHSTGAHAVSVSWLPPLAAFLERERQQQQQQQPHQAGSSQRPGTPEPQRNGSSPGPPGSPLTPSWGTTPRQTPPGPLQERLPDLPSPIVEELRASLNPVVGGAVVGDLISGPALLVLEADGQPHCLWPSRFSSATQGPRLPAAGPASEPPAKLDADVAAGVDLLYGQLLRGPRNMSLPAPPAGGAVSAQTPEGQRLLVESVAVMRDRHVQFAYQASQQLGQRMERMGQEAADQVAQAQELHAALRSAAEGSSRLEQRLQQVSRAYTDAEARFKRLAERLWAMPQPLSNAEREFRHVQLPEMQSFEKDLDKKIQALAERTERLRDRQAAQTPTSRASALQSARGLIPPAQLRRVRGAVTEQEELLGHAMRKLGLVENMLRAKQDEAPAPWE